VSTSLACSCTRLADAHHVGKAGGQLVELGGDPRCLPDIACMHNACAGRPKSGWSIASWSGDEQQKHWRYSVGPFKATTCSATRLVLQVVGVVQEVGAGVSMMKPGDRVGVGWIASSCRKCRSCLKGEENTCKEGYTGLIVNGECTGALVACRNQKEHPACRCCAEVISCGGGTSPLASATGHPFAAVVRQCQCRFAECRDHLPLERNSFLGGTAGMW
jgi:hypothetical protein